MKLFIRYTSFLVGIILFSYVSYAKKRVLDLRKGSVNIGLNSGDTIKKVLRSSRDTQVTVSLFNSRSGDSNTYFSKQFHTRSVKMHGSLNHVIFEGNVDFSLLEFHNMEVNNCQFLGETSFSANEFNSLKLHTNTFHADVDFAFSVGNEFNIYQVIFYGNVNFTNCQFRDRTDFYKSSFHGNVFFNGTRFGHTAIFENLDLRSAQLDFTNAWLPDTLLFGDNKQISNEIDFEAARFEKHKILNRNILTRYFAPFFYNIDSTYCLIDLSNSDISKIKFNYKDFRLRLSTTDGNVGKIYKVYEEALKNFKDRGQTEDYMIMDIEYHYVKTIGSRWKTFWQASLPDWWWRFGYEKERIFLHIFVFLIFFTITTSPIIMYLHTNIYPLENIQRREGQIINNNFPKWSIIKRIGYSGIYTAIIFFSFSIKFDRFLFKRRKKGLKGSIEIILGTLYIVIVSVAGLVCLGYLANLILQK